MLWGITLQPGEPYTEQVVDEVRLSMASLEFRSSKTAVSCPLSHVVVTTVKGEYLLCSLEKGCIPQQSLDLVLQPKEEVTFTIEGTGVVHLTGYTPEGPQEYIECSPEDEMIYIEEEGSDEPDHGPTSLATSNVKSDEESTTNEIILPEDVSQRQNSDRCSADSYPATSNVKSDEESTTNEIIFPEDVSQRQNSDQCSADSYPENAVKAEQLDNGISEGVYEGWILEDNHPHTQSPDISEEESSNDDEEEVPSNKPNNASSIQLQRTPINPSHKRQRSASSLVNQAKGVLKKLKQMPYQCNYFFNEFSSDLPCKRDQDSNTEDEDGDSNNDALDDTNVDEVGDIAKLMDIDFDQVEARRSKSAMCTVGRPYSCKICKTSFTLLSSFVAHGRLHSVENAVKRPTYEVKVDHSMNVHIEGNENKTTVGHSSKRSKVTDRSENGGRPHLCHYCRKPFSSNSKRILHERKHTGEKPYVCKHCMRGFAAVGDCRRHEQLHTEEGMLNLPRCRYCSKPFYSISKCLIHERIHTGEKPFKCGLCERAFSQKGHLKTHERTHTGERPFQCQHCDRGFSTGSGRKKTRETAHWEENVKIEIMATISYVFDD